MCYLDALCKTLLCHFLQFRMIINKVIKPLKILIPFCAIFLLQKCSLNTNLKYNNSDDYFTVHSDSTENNLSANEDVISSYHQNIIDPKIKSIQISSEKLKLVEPCYYLNSEQNINIDFDLIEADPHPLQYEIIHCDMNWDKSDLMVMEYLNGFDINYIDDVMLSHGTQEQYVHYHFQLPNENIQFLKSGNYSLNIFHENENDKPLLRLRFYVSEESAKASLNISRTSNIDQRNYMHAVELHCNYNYNTIDDPFQNLIINIQQNHQEFDELWFYEPNFVRDDKVTFLMNEDRIFNGGNEFRFFDMSNLITGGQNTSNVTLNENGYQVKLRPEIKRTYRQYFEYKDFNGKFVIQSHQSDLINTQAEYATVLFELPMKKIKEDIYLFGQFTNWGVHDEFLMKYDSVSQKYYNKINLKQGYYNYIYICKSGEKTDARKMEGSHFDTNNEYIIKVYYRDPLGLYDRLLHYQVYDKNT